MTMRWLALPAALAVIACGSPQPSTCTADCAGCCDSKGQCQSGTVSSACGAKAGACVVCANGRVCSNGACVKSTGAGGGTGGGLAVTTCASNSFWMGNLQGSPEMKPGTACLECHEGRNFQNQNPTLAAKPSANFTYMGTVYPSLHEKDSCNGLDAGTAVVELLDLAGNVTGAIPVSPVSGNFHSALSTGAPPGAYKARIRYNGRTNTMVTSQTVGDCNVCHTEQGTSGAPGRITLP